MSFQQILKQYNFEYPKELIAQQPTHPRDSARLLVYDRKSKTTTLDVFSNLGRYLPKNAVLVLNQTKVIPARFTVTKPTGGRATLLYISHDSQTITVLPDRRLPINARLNLTRDSWFVVVDQNGNQYILKPSFPISKLFTILKKHGQTPIPPYIKHSPLSESKLRSEYQTVFAKTKGSIAAPTASLHLTKPLLNKLKKQGIQIEYITLHVNLGTFATLTEKQIKTGKLHKEYYEISKAAAKRLNKAKRSEKLIIAVGTTVVRTLESASSFRPSEPNERVEKSHSLANARMMRSLDSARDDGEWFLKHLSGDTDLFIQKHYNFKFVDGIITNFHVPKSSLLMLVSAFTGRKKLLELYQLAIHNRFRLFSFGDGMMIY